MKKSILQKNILFLAFLLMCFKGYSYTEEILNYKPSIGEYGDFSICYPDDWQATDKRPVIILVHGGAWVSGSYGAFSSSLKWTPYFADKGMVAISINYRLDRIANAVMDCRSAIRYIKDNADVFGIDTTKVVAGGQSAGGHLSFCMYSADGLDDPTDNLSISPRPNLFIFLDGALSMNGSRMAQITDDVGATLAAGCQPSINVRPDFPPTLYLYGSADGYRESGHLTYDRALAHGIRQEMWLAEGGSHGYGFNYPEWNQNSIYLAHQFLEQYGYVTGLPTAPLPTVQPVMYEQTFAGGRSTLIAPTSVICVPSEKSGQVKENMINGSGISENPVIQNSYHEFSDEYTWRSLNDNTGKVIFDFGEQVDFDQIHLWNYNGSNNYVFLGINEVEVYASSGTDTAAANFTYLKTLKLFEEGHYCQNFDLVGTNVRLLKFNIVSNFASIYTGFNELRVSHSSALAGEILPTDIVLDKLSLPLGDGETAQLTATVYPTNATNKAVTWTTSNPAVVTVNSSGLVSVVGEGNAYVTAATQAGVAKVKCYISVHAPKPLLGVAVNPTSLSIAQGFTGQLSPVFNPANASNKNVTWSSSNESVATVDANGLVTGVLGGTASITVTTDEGSFTATSSITVTAPISVSSVALNMSDNSIANDGSFQLIATVNPTNASNKSVSWKSSDATVATVNASGFVEGVLPGVADIIVTTDDGDFTDTCTVTVSLNSSTAMETFTNLNASTTDHTNGSYTGDNGEIWYYERTMLKESGSGITGPCAELRANNGVLETVIQDGIKNLTFTFLNQEGYTSASFTRINVQINDSVFGTYSLDVIDVAKTVTIEDINFYGPDTLRITPGGWYTRLDDIVWTTPDPIVDVSGITLSQSSFSFNTSEIIDLVATVEPSNATNKNVIWTSNDEDVATVNSFGAVSSVAPGTCFITATTEDGGFIAKCEVTVNPIVIDVESVSLNKENISIIDGATYQLTASINPSTATNTNVSWKSSVTGIVSVNSLGLVTAESVGEAYVVVTTDDGAITDTCFITVTSIPVPVTGVNLNIKNLILVEGNNSQLNATVSPSNATNTDVTWKSSDAGIVTVTTSGLVTAESAGEAYVVVTTDDGAETDTCYITVEVAIVSVTGVSLNTETLTLVEGNTSQLSATVLPSNATNTDVTWKSSDAGIVTVTTSGLVTAESAGEAYVVVTTDDGAETDTCYITVEVVVIPVTGVSLNTKTLTLVEGNTSQLKATVYPSNATNADVSWKSSDKDVVAVNADGLITAILQGDAYIVVTTDDGILTDTCFVLIEKDIDNLANKYSNESINIYPNPTNAMVNITNVSIGSELKVYSISGKIAYRGVAISNSIQLDISKWDNGMYIIDIKNDYSGFTNYIIKD